MNKRKYSPNLGFTDPVYRMRNLLYSINGLIGGNLPIMTMKERERVRCYLFANSNEEDVHTVHWHGQTVLLNQMRTDTVHLGPMMNGSSGHDSWQRRDVALPLSRQRVPQRWNASPVYSNSSKKCLI